MSRVHARALAVSARVFAEGTFNRDAHSRDNAVLLVRAQTTLWKEEEKEEEEREGQGRRRAMHRGRTFAIELVAATRVF
jgi:hypothetical protein